MIKIQNLAGEVYQIEDVVLGAGRVIEMEDAMAERFLAQFKGQVEVASKETLKVSEKKVTKKKK